VLSFFPFAFPTMFAASPQPSFPPVDALLASLAQVDWRRRFIQLLLLAATVAAVIVAVSTFAYKKAREFWQNHGEEITLRFELFVEWLVAAIEKTHQAGTASRPVAARWLNWLVDQAFYLLAD
jgi:hypothetical protein